jgi:hypothetical protein
MLRQSSCCTQPDAFNQAPWDALRPAGDGRSSPAPGAAKRSAGDQQGSVPSSAEVLVSKRVRSEGGPGADGEWRGCIRSEPAGSTCRASSSCTGALLAASRQHPARHAAPPAALRGGSSRWARTNHAAPCLPLQRLPRPPQPSRASSCCCPTAQTRRRRPPSRPASPARPTAARWSRWTRRSWPLPRPCPCPLPPLWPAPWLAPWPGPATYRPPSPPSAR